MTFIHWVQGEVSTNEHLGVETVEQYDKSRMGNITFNNSNGLCNKPCVFRKDEASMDEHLAVETVEQHEESRKGNRNFNDSNGLCNRTCSLTYQKKKKKLVISGNFPWFGLVIIGHVDLFSHSVKWSFLREDSFFPFSPLKCVEAFDLQQELQRSFICF